MRAPDFWNRTDVRAQVVAAMLSPLGWAYSAATAWKRLHAHPYRSTAKVVCVGNLTAGGSGKTPVTLEVVRILADRGLRVAVLTRGYGGTLKGPVVVDPAQHSAFDVGDEALLLAAKAPTIVSADRRAGARLAETLGIQIIVMDDGYQNFALAKDLSLLVVDAKTGFGNGRAIPAGPLREEITSGLARADAVVLVGEGSPALPAYRGPVLRGKLVPDDQNAWTGKRLFAFAGIGRPEKFFATLRELRAELVDAIPFPDHHMFTLAEMEALKRNADAKSAVLVTTEKDFVRLRADHRAFVETLPVQIAFEIPSDLSRLLDHVAPPTVRPA